MDAGRRPHDLACAQRHRGDRLQAVIDRDNGANRDRASQNRHEVACSRADVRRVEADLRQRVSQQVQYQRQDKSHRERRDDAQARRVANARHILRPEVLSDAHARGCAKPEIDHEDRADELDRQTIDRRRVDTDERGDDEGEVETSPLGDIRNPGSKPHHVLAPELVGHGLAHAPERRRQPDDRREKQHGHEEARDRRGPRHANCAVFRDDNQIEDEIEDHSRHRNRGYDVRTAQRLQIHGAGEARHVADQAVGEDPRDSHGAVFDVEIKAEQPEQRFSDRKAHTSGDNREERRHEHPAPEHPAALVRPTRAAQFRRNDLNANHQPHAQSEHDAERQPCVQNIWQLAMRAARQHDGIRQAHQHEGRARGCDRHGEAHEIKHLARLRPSWQFSAGHR